MVRPTKIQLIAGDVRKNLLSKELHTGDRIPSVRSLMMRYHISATTADGVLNFLRDEKFIYRLPKKGSFISHDTPPLLRIAYLGETLSTMSDDPLISEGIEKAFEELSEYGNPTYIFPYCEFSNSSKAAEKLKQFNGLLIGEEYLDSNTLPVLQSFKGKIVLVGAMFPEDRLHFSQVITDFMPALNEISENIDIARYSRFLILSAGHPNAVAVEKQIREYFTAASQKIDTIFFDNQRTGYELTAYKHFIDHPSDYDDTLIFSLSYTFSSGLRSAFETLGIPIPDVISFDNIEGHSKSNGKNPFFTAVDREYSRMYFEAVHLLVKMIRERDDRNYQIRIPAKFVIRNSIRSSALKSSIKGCRDRPTSCGMNRSDQSHQKP